jgi:hypothetical protein
MAALCRHHMFDVTAVAAEGDAVVVLENTEYIVC